MAAIQATNEGRAHSERPRSTITRARMELNNFDQTSRPKSAQTRSSHSASSTSLLYKNTTFSLLVLLKETGETFKLTDVNNNMTTKELKSALEIVAGIPTDFQRLHYLDKGDLLDDSTVHFNNIIPGTGLTMTTWPYNGWPELVQAAVKGNIYKLKNVLSRPSTPCSSASSWHTGPGPCSASPWQSHRLFSALFIASHRGHAPAVHFLIEQGANVGHMTPEGRGALHVAAAHGHVGIMKELLFHGAPTCHRDQEGMTPMSMATKLGQKKSIEKFILFHWQDRAADLKLKSHLDKKELFPHQQLDSHHQIWYRGHQCQKYMAHMEGLGRGEVTGEKWEKGEHKECWGVWGKGSGGGGDGRPVRGECMQKEKDGRKVKREGRDKVGDKMDKRKRLYHLLTLGPPQNTARRAARKAHEVQD